ncbi:MAG: Asp-tRNA(Asn)/Glu-tRNA(Gln) amidotransferase subunit GatC [Clostridia bacterium]|nr:Asp-tRNA(Asn)/Glu-tRNA(Gln) amidotransferase subunit GatC [Clostridia bacterium]
MQVSREELLHIAKLSDLKINEEEIDNYRLNLEDILNFAEIVKNANVEGLDETIGANDNFNVFREDEIKEFEDRDALLANAPEKERDMFKVPKVIQ